MNHISRILGKASWKVTFKYEEFTFTHIVVAESEEKAISMAGGCTDFLDWIQATTGLDMPMVGDEIQPSDEDLAFSGDIMNDPPLVKSAISSVERTEKGWTACVYTINTGDMENDEGGYADEDVVPDFVELRVHVKRVDQSPSHFVPIPDDAFYNNV